MTGDMLIVTSSPTEDLMCEAYLERVFDRTPVWWDEQADTCVHVECASPDGQGKLPLDGGPDWVVYQRDDADGYVVCLRSDDGDTAHVFGDLDSAMTFVAERR